MKGSNIRGNGENALISDGIILTDKAEGETSYDVVRRFKKILNMKKIGHAGTLDPFATGLLIILVGQGTKLSSYIMAGRKRYSATIEMGLETDTLDPTGSIVREMPVPKLELKDLIEVVQSLTGEIEQTPPAYSAVSYKGERAYRLARRGEKVELDRRKVKIYSIDIRSVELPFIALEICCSSGTYIRSLASEIGLKAGTVAHLKELRRISSGTFSVESAVRCGDIDACDTPEKILRSFFDLNDALPDMAVSRLEKDASRKIRNGCIPEWNDLRTNSSFPEIFEGSIKVVDDSSLVAIMEVSHLHKNENNWLKKIRVFN